jgi:hypothetical protein
VPALCLTNAGRWMHNSVQPKPLPSVVHEEAPTIREDWATLGGGMQSMR